MASTSVKTPQRRSARKTKSTPKKKQAQESKISKISSGNKESPKGAADMILFETPPKKIKKDMAANAIDGVSLHARSLFGNDSDEKENTCRPMTMSSRSTSSATWQRPISNHQLGRFTSSARASISSCPMTSNQSLTLQLCGLMQRTLTKALLLTATTFMCRALPTLLCYGRDHTSICLICAHGCGKHAQPRDNHLRRGEGTASLFLLKSE